MCRMFALTTTNLPANLTTYIVDSAMARHTADDAQFDGYGIAVPGKIIHKSDEAYWRSPPVWMARHREIDNKMVMGHVRKASLNTVKRDTAASHPYVFVTKSGDTLILQHNGQVDDLSTYDYKSGYPNTDSYRAAMRLVSLLDETDDCTLTSEVIHKWLDGFYYTSVYVFFVLYRDELIVIRGSSDRFMFTSRVGNGYMLATSRLVLEAMLCRLGQFNVYIPEGDPVIAVPEYSTVRFKPGIPDYDIEAYRPQFIVTKSKVYTSVGASTATAPRTSTSVTTLVDSNHSVRPRPKVNASNKKEFSSLRDKFNPMRLKSIMFWIAHTNNMVNPKTGEYKVSDVLALSQIDLDDFADYTAPFTSNGSSSLTFTSGEGTSEIFSKTQKQIINLFNKIVPMSIETEVVTRFFYMFGQYYWNYTLVELDVLSSYFTTLVANPSSSDDDMFADNVSGGIVLARIG